MHVRSLRAGAHSRPPARAATAERATLGLRAPQARSPAAQHWKQPVGGVNHHHHRPVCPGASGTAALCVRQSVQQSVQGSWQACAGTEGQLLFLRPVTQMALLL